MKQKKYTACQTCGFPKEVNREPIFLDNNVVSIMNMLDDEETMRCLECKRYKDGSTIPIVAEKLREIHKKSKEQGIQQTKDIYNKKIQELKAKIKWGKNHGNGDWNSTKAVLEDINKTFEDNIKEEKQ